MNDEEARSHDCGSLEMNRPDRQRTYKRGRVVAACIVGDCRYLAGPLVWCLIRPGFGVGVTREKRCITVYAQMIWIIHSSLRRLPVVVNTACSLRVTVTF